MEEVNWLDCVGKGWHELVQHCIDQCKKEGVEIHQVKEKFGTLRFYAAAGSLALEKVIDDAEWASAHTCEDCGFYQPTSLVKDCNGWDRALCETCSIKHMEKRK